jgi:hypothetical protein
MRRSVLSFSSMIYMAISATALLAAASTAWGASGEIDLDRVEDGTLYFRTADGKAVPKPVKTDLHDLKYLGPLRDPAGRSPASFNGGETPSPSQTYFLFSGRPCKDCLQDSNIYAIRASGGKPFSFVYPGKIVDTKTGAPVLESRAFFGRCIYRNPNPTYVVFQKERVDRRNGLQPSVFIATPGEDHLSERLIERNLPRIQDTLKLVKAKVCQEIDGRNRNALRKPLDLILRHGGDNDKDTDDSEGESEADSKRAETGNERSESGSDANAPADDDGKGAESPAPSGATASSDELVDEISSGAAAPRDRNKASATAKRAHAKARKPAKAQKPGKVAKAAKPSSKKAASSARSSARSSGKAARAGKKNATKGKVAAKRGQAGKRSPASSPATRRSRDADRE